MKHVLLLVDRVGIALASAACLLLLGLVMADILLRQIDVPFFVTIEYSGFLMAFITFLPLADITGRRAGTITPWKPPAEN